MKAMKFKYKTVTINFEEQPNEYDKSRGIEESHFERILNINGDYGWEACSSFRKYWWKRNPIIVVFKKNLSTSPN